QAIALRPLPAFHTSLLYILSMFIRILFKVMLVAEISPVDILVVMHIAGVEMLHYDACDFSRRQGKQLFRIGFNIVNGFGHEVPFDLLQFFYSRAFSAADQSHGLEMGLIFMQE